MTFFQGSLVLHTTQILIYALFEIINTFYIWLFKKNWGDLQDAQIDFFKTSGLEFWKSSSLVKQAAVSQRIF